MDSIDSGKAAFTYSQPVHTMVSLPVVADRKAERIESALESSSKAKEYSLGEWEQQRGHITNLYVAQKKTLPQVADLMESKYGFVASQRQYKRRFAKWGLDTKNIRDHDMRLALAKDLKRKREGKDTEFEINGRLLPRQKMQRFMARKELSEEDVIQSDAPTPSYVTYHTPRPVEDDDVIDTLASISLGKDEIIADACVTYDERTENLHDHSKSIQPDEQNGERASTSLSILLSFGEVSKDTTRILERNEAWLERRYKARNDPELILAYARLILPYMRQGSTTLHKNFRIWRSYFERRRLESFDSYSSKKSRFLLDFIIRDFETLESSLMACSVFHEVSAPLTSIDSATELFPKNPTMTRRKPIFPHFATNQDSDYGQPWLKALSNSPALCSDFIRDNIREEPFHELQPIPTASPLERWSQRYDISSSPNWIRSYMSPRNPLLLLKPAPIGTPWDHIQRASPRSTGSQGYGSRVFNSDNFLVDYGISPGLHDQAMIEDLIPVETKVHSGEVMQRWEPGEDFCLAPILDARWQ